jgi:hypothetical protein
VVVVAVVVAVVVVAVVVVVVVAAAAAAAAAAVAVVAVVVVVAVAAVVVVVVVAGTQELRASRAPPATQAVTAVTLLEDATGHAALAARTHECRSVLPSSTPGLMDEICRLMWRSLQISPLIHYAFPCCFRVPAARRQGSFACAVP